MTGGALQVPEPEMVTPPPTSVGGMVQVPLSTLPDAVGMPVPASEIVTVTLLSVKVAVPVMLPSKSIVPVPAAGTPGAEKLTVPLEIVTSTVLLLRRLPGIG